MPVRTRPVRAFLERRANKRDARPDNRLAVTDHAVFAQHEVMSQDLVIQVVWVYEVPIDVDGVRLFNRNLGYGLFGRCIERSTFGRHRWVLNHEPADVDVAQCARPRTELSDWADERAQLPIDPESGPGWHLGVLPLTDGSTAISLVVSHYLVDGFGLGLAIAEAVFGHRRDLGYPPPRSGTRLRAVAQDARQALQDTPQVGRALLLMARGALRRGDNVGRSPAPRPVVTRPEGEGDDPILVPGIFIRIDPDDWDSRAKALGGTGNTLLVALVARLAEHMGRRRASDGAVTLQLPLSDRSADDSRALAVSITRLSVDPTPLTTDLSDLRASIKQVLTRSARDTRRFTADSLADPLRSEADTETVVRSDDSQPRSTGVVLESRRRPLLGLRLRQHRRRVRHHRRRSRQTASRTSDRATPIAKLA